MRALVTGGAGFIGSHVVRLLLADGNSVRVLDNFSTGCRENLGEIAENVEWITGDIRDRETCRAACAGTECVFHLAAFISVPGSVADPVGADAINIQGTLNVLLAARDAGVRRLVFSSSSAIYGDTLVVPTPETITPRPISPYGLEKLYGEHACRIHQTADFSTVALRYFNIFGPRQNPNSDYAAVIPIFMRMMLRGQSPTIHGDGGQTHDFLFVDDVARANLLAAAAPQEAAGSVCNIAGGSATSVLEMANAIASATGFTGAIQHGPERVADIRHSSADISLARRILGFDPSVSIDTGLRTTLNWLAARV